MLKHPQITRDRVRQFVAHDLLEKLVLATAPLGAEFLKGSFRTDHAARRAEGWQPVEPGFTWGPTYAEGWFRVAGSVPGEWKGTVVLTYNQSMAGFGQGKLLDWRGPVVEGTLWKDGATVGGLDWAHSFFRLGSAREFDLCVQTFAPNKETTVHRPEQPRTAQPAEFHGFLLALVDEELLALYHDCWGAHDLLQVLPEEEPGHAILLRALNDVCNRFAEGRPKNLAAARRVVSDALSSLTMEPHHTVTAVGHAHLDTAWLWPLAVTRLKMLHTCSLQLDLIDRYSDYVFVHSQASQYEWLEQEYPHVLERIQKAVKKGQWEPVGSMWVEADCNLTGAESLVRQFLYGRRYFRQKFGVTTEDMWLPDVFGYSAALPQILSKFGIKFFLTQKMSWNQFNKIPHNTFWWQGIDGSRVWTHFPPADNYCSDCAPSDMVKAMRKHRDHGRSDRSLYLFGFGDGGGGPTEQHIERLRRNRKTPVVPDIEQRAKAVDFFHHAMEESRDLCTWVGELYFEFHRGTYTSQAANKAHNRRCEMMLRDLELLAAFSPEYPRAEIERLWKTVLLNQFHDIIPGSSVREVYEDSEREYAEIEATGEAMVTDAVRAFGNQLDTKSKQRPVALFHQAEVVSEARLPWMDHTAPGSLECGGERVPVQLVTDDDGTALVFPVPSAARGAVAVGDLSDRPAESSPRLRAGNRRIENDELVVRFDANGNITSVTTQDDDPLEFIQPGELANVLQVLDDKPLFWDAWDTDIYSQETAKPVLRAESVRVVEKGPVRAAIEVVRRFGSSTVKQRISLGPTPGIRFDTWVDWHETNKMLKVAFPLNVHTDQASFDIQFGHVKRPTHRNTSWDVARFEVCAQKWADLSEGGHGVAVINQGKYGHDVLGNVLRLSLLKSPKAPDPECDMGRHRFTYVLYPHFDGVTAGRVVAASYAVNARPWVVPLNPNGGEAVQLPPFVRVNTRNLVVESVKRAEDSDALVVRLYECHQARGRAVLEVAGGVKRAHLANLEEIPSGDALEITAGGVAFDYKPFEIITLLIEA